MNHINYSRFFYLFLSFSLLIAPLPLSAMVEKAASNLEFQICKTVINDDSYVYLGSELSNIAEIVDIVSAWDDDKKSMLHELKNYIDNDFFLAPYDAVVGTLAYAEAIIEQHISRSNNKNLFNKLIVDFELLVNQLTSGLLHVDIESLQLDNNEVYRYGSCTPKKRPPLVVNEKPTFTKNVRMKKNLRIDGHLNVDKSALFEDDVTVEGTISVTDGILASLSVTDLAVTNCMNSLCVNSFSANDAVIQDLTVVTTVSVLDSIIQNLTVFGTLSTADAIIEDLTVTNCMANLCVNSLSVVDMAISGTLSINDIIIGDATVTDFSATDAVVQSLSVTDLVVVSCMDSLCVNSLSVG